MRQPDRFRAVLLRAGCLATCVMALSACRIGSPGAVTAASGGPTATAATSAGAGTALPPTSAAGVASAEPVRSDRRITRNVYAAAGPGMLSPVAATARPLVYVPDTLAGRVDVIDPATFRVIRSFAVSSIPQHVVPSWDLKTLWVNESGGSRLTPIDPRTGRPGRSVPVTDPYNLYFTPNGAHAMVMAERLGRIDFRDPHTMALQRSLRVPCRGVNHADFTADLTRFVVSCEFSGTLLVVPADGSRVQQVINLNRLRTRGATSATTARRMGGPASGLQRGATSMPQDVRLTPDGSTFLVADMLRNGVWLVDAQRMRVRGFLPTGRGAHGIYPSRDGRAMYVSNRDAGSVSVLDAGSLRVRAVWRVPGGGSPDMGGVSVDGRTLWLSGRSNGVVYVFDTVSGRLLRKIPVHAGPHGLCVWPQPGRFSLGHTGNLR